MEFMVEMIIGIVKAIITAILVKIALYIGGIHHVSFIMLWMIATIHIFLLYRMRIQTHNTIVVELVKHITALSQKLDVNKKV